MVLIKNVEVETLMAKYLMICEKPSLMKDIKNCYFNHKREINQKIGYIDFIALAGHVCCYALPNDYPDYADVKWEDIDYPIVPAQWKINSINDKKNILKEIKNIVDDYDGIIVGTDSDTEGSGIYYLLEQYLGLQNKKALRFMEHSLTDSEILKSLLEMTDFHTDPKHVNSTNSFLLRSRADWLFGMNGTRYSTVKSNLRKTLTVGRVKAVVIKLVHDNSLEIDNFVPETSYQEVAKYPSFEGYLINDDNKVIQVCEKKYLPQWPPDEGIVTDANSKIKEYHCPKLYDLSAIQIEAGTKFGFSPTKTLSIIQSLYETHKVISYPRTQCRYVSAEKAKQFPQMIKQAAVFKELNPFVEMVTEDDIKKVYADKSVVNDKEVNKESHDALLPTDKTPDLSKLTDDEQKICLMIYKRLLAQFMSKYKVNISNVIIAHGEYKFLAKGEVVLEQGWKVLYRTEQGRLLPDLKKGDRIDVSRFMIRDVVTRPPKRLTEATLVKSMEHIGEFIEDKELGRTLMDSKGIGTPATRHTIINDIIKRGYVEKKRNGLYITNLGIQYINLIKDTGMTDPVFAALMDRDIKRVQRGELDFHTAYSIVLDKLNDICNRISQIKPVKRSTVSKCDILCPYCGENLIKNKYYFKCNCGKTNIQRFICGVEVTETDLKTMVDGEVTDKKKFKRKDGKEFEGRLELKDGALSFNFSSGIMP